MSASFAPTLESAAFAALMCADPAEKCRLTARLAEEWCAGRLARAGSGAAALPRIETPGRPERPALVAADAVPRRSPFTPEGHAALLHAIAHIEFNAINLALDCVARFPEMPERFAADWVKVAAEEAYHFGLVCERLDALEHAYGDFPAHNGLWEMAVKTDADLCARMALVPRVLEARGLDATPPIIAKLRAVGDEATIAVLDIILRDEIGHVAIGDYWFRVSCAQRGLEPEATYRDMIERFEAPPPKPPFNREARLAAGFSEAELASLEAAAAARRKR
ncbi:ferritin-like domain-containing protein [Niveibacterium sp. SC-1]|uniref:ferritin-like domain-containing protein n=1 Tax=Niveibacterium sp. SC-1 TaxID=3135646 RepID=UPI00311DB492